jgi:ribosomal-protein-serine acetyltransferase
MLFATPRPGLELRLLEEQHAEEVFALVDKDREYLNEWLPWPILTLALDDTRQFIQRNLQQFADNLGFAAGLWWRGRFCGVTGTQPIDWTNRATEIGYWIGRDFQGQGLMTDSVRSLIHHAFCQWNLNRIQIRVAVGNERSAAIPNRLGFQLEGIVREAQLLHGRFIDLRIFSLLASEWKQG